jgi:hypothetical protein
MPYGHWRPGTVNGNLSAMLQIVRVCENIHELKRGGMFRPRRVPAGGSVMCKTLSYDDGSCTSGQLTQPGYE